MAINKVIANGNTLIDLTSDTVDAEHLATGYTAHDKAGDIITGTMSAGGINGVTELYSSDNVSITYTSTSAGTGKSITGITGLCSYPFIIVIIENTNDTSGTLKFVRSSTVIGNVKYSSNTASVTRYGTQHYYTSNGTLTNISSTSYGLWGYTISTSSGGTLTIRARCNASYYTSLTGTYRVRVLGVKF